MKDLPNPKFRTDMAAECCEGKADTALKGVIFRETEVKGIAVSRLAILNKEGEAAIGKAKGNYVTLSLGPVWLSDDRAFDTASEVLGEELHRMAKALVPDLSSVLVVGLGNRFITSDAIGPLTVKALTVTRHLQTMEPALFERLGTLPIAAVSPGVVGQTGIETADLIRATVRCAFPSLVVCVDALAARSVERLAVTVQLSDVGLSPGSGIGNRRRAMDSETLGAPVIAIGVPTVVDAATLVNDVLERAGMTDPPDSLRTELERGRHFFVTVRDADAAASEMARLLAAAIERAFSRSDGHI